MAHLTEGALRRLYDEPEAVTASMRQHHNGCSRCQHRLNAIAEDARGAATLLGASDIRVDTADALRLLQDRVRREQSKRPVRPYERWLAAAQVRWPTVARPVAVALVAAAMMSLLAATGVAQNLLTIFEPKQFVAVPVTTSDVTWMPDLTAYGTLKWSPRPPDVRPVANAATAEAESGLPILVPASLPPGVPAAVSYAVVPRTTATFTFSAAKARAAAATAGKSLPPMPTNIDGSTLYVTAGPALLEVYGGGSRVETTPEGVLPTLVIAQARAPRVTSTGVSTKELEDYLLAQPGISSQLQAQIRAIGDPTQTLPIPVPTGLAASHPVQVAGVQGIFVSDSTGLGSALIWLKDGIAYAVAGKLSESQIVAIARSLP